MQLNTIISNLGKAIWDFNMLIIALILNLKSIF